MSEPITEASAVEEGTVSADASSGVFVGEGHSVLLEPDHDTTPTPPADPLPVNLPLPQASTGSVDVAWEVLDVLTGPDGLL